MDSWRRQLGEIRHQDLKIARSRNRKPPLGSGCCNVPSWEKQFCTSIGSVPWWKIVDTKKCMYLYDNVVKWDDSAGKEAFQNAKRRFWAKLNGFPCNISLPDPDIYIDKVDWDSNDDPNLFLDLERETDQPMSVDENEILSGLGNALGLNQSFWCMGWGEAEWGEEYGNGDSTLDNAGCRGERGCSWDGEEWNNCWNRKVSSGRKNWENQKNKLGNNYNMWEDGVRDEEAWRRWDSHSWNKGWDGGCRQLALNSWNRSSDQSNDLLIKDHRTGNSWGMNRRGGMKMVNFSDWPYRPVSHRDYGNKNRWR